MTTSELLSAALTHQKAGRLDQAASLYETILTDAPDHADALHYSALIALRRGDAAAAIERLDRAAAAAPQKPVIHNDRGASLRLAGRLAEAKDALQRATELEPGYADAWNNLGIVLRAIGDFAGARDALERAAALQPRFAPTYNALGGRPAARSARAMPRRPLSSGRSRSSRTMPRLRPISACYCRRAARCRLRSRSCRRLHRSRPMSPSRT